MNSGNKILLDTIEFNDLEQLRIWRNQEEFKKFFREFREISSSMQKEWFDNIVNHSSNNFMFAIRKLDNNQLIGCIGLTYVNWVYRHADLSIYIGDNSIYIDDDGYASEAVEIVMEYGFNQLGLNKIWTEIYSFDNVKETFFKNLNFNVDGFLRENYFYNGTFWDSIIFSKLAKEFNSTKGN